MNIIYCEPHSEMKMSCVGKLFSSIREKIGDPASIRILRPFSDRSLCVICDGDHDNSEEFFRVIVDENTGELQRIYGSFIVAYMDGKGKLHSISDSVYYRYFDILQFPCMSICDSDGLEKIYAIDFEFGEIRAFDDVLRKSGYDLDK